LIDAAECSSARSLSLTCSDIACIIAAKLEQLPPPSAIFPAPDKRRAPMNNGCKKRHQQMILAKIKEINRIYRDDDRTDIRALPELRDPDDQRDGVLPGLQPAGSAIDLELRKVPTHVGGPEIHGKLEADKSE